MALYRLRSAASALIQEATRPIAISIPAGTVLKGPDGSANAAGYVEVEWEGKSILVFAVDLRERGELLRAMSATGGSK